LGIYFPHSNAHQFRSTNSINETNFTLAYNNQTQEAYLTYSEPKIT